MELRKGCEVKRKTLNLVVSPETKELGKADALFRAASHRGRRAKTSASLRPGVADSIEQHTHGDRELTRQARYAPGLCREIASFCEQGSLCEPGMPVRS